MSIFTNIEPLISICIASYNYGQYLSRGFEAIKRQNFKYYEILYIDDASADNSVKIIKGFMNENPEVNIRLIEHEINRGLLYTKTELLKEARGKYVMLCDADDWMADNCLEILGSYALKGEADRIISQVYDIDERGNLLQIQDFADNPSKWLWNLHHGCLYRRSIITENEIRISRYPDDVYLTTAFNQYCKKVEWIREPLYYWYVHKNSVGRRKKDGIDGVIFQFRQIASDIVAISEQEILKEDKEKIGLLLVKLYYLQLFHEFCNFSLLDKIRAYYKIRNHMRNIYPEYLENCYLKWKGMQPARKYAMNIMRMGRILEKLHLMWAALICYHILSYWIHFDQ